MNHPFDVAVSKLTRWAKDHHRVRGVQPERLKVIPEHILARQDENYHDQWGMYNYRLDQWVDADEHFRTEEIAKTWYRSLI